MKKFILFMLLLTSVIFPQLKEMEVKPTENRGGIPIFRDFPDKAGIIFYAQFNDLSFYSSYGIVKVMDESGGKFIVIVEAVKQTLEVRAPGFKTEMIKLTDLQPKDLLSYEIFPKEEERDQGVTEVGITLQVTPADAEIMIDRESFPHNRTKKLSIGKHRLKVEKKNYVTYDEEIIISTDITLFQIELKYDVASTMVKVEGSTFKMGSNDGQSQEKPIHRVTLNSFMIGKYEVTQELWESVMGNNPSYYKGSNRPVEQVNWYEAVEFCNKLSEKEGFFSAYTINKEMKDTINGRISDGYDWTVTHVFSANGYRLPTEAEWEYAARGGKKSKGYKYSGSNNAVDVAWTQIFDKQGNITNLEGTSEVGKKRPNELGIYDMSGNVYEWCWDWYGDYHSGSQTNPTGPTTGGVRILRGDNWDADVTKLSTVHSRAGFSPNSSVYFNFAIGFRLVRNK